MSDNKFCGSRDRICIETNRILDSCRDRDCYENIGVYLTEFGQEIIEHTTNVRVKNAQIAWTCINIDPIQFNRGFYAVNIKFYICLQFEACMCGQTREFEGVTVVEKKVILFGGDSEVSVYRSGYESSACCSEGSFTKNTPTAVVEVVAPVVLDVNVAEVKECGCCCCCCLEEIPETILGRLNGSPADTQGRARVLRVTIGIFSVVRIVRPAQYLISGTEYSVPDKECISDDDRNPCQLFRSMAFPTREFSSPSFHQGPCDEERIPVRHCGCDRDQK